MKRWGVVAQPVVLLALIALAARCPHQEPPPSAPSPAPSPVAPPAPPVPPPADWWALAVADLDTHARDLPGYAQVRALARPGPRPAPKVGELFDNYCASCHGPDGEPLGHEISTGPPIQLTQPGEYKRGVRELAILRTIRYGIPRTGMAPVDMSEAEAWAVALYVRRLQVPSPGPPSQRP